MKLHFARIPIVGGEEAAEELNGFLSAHRIVALDRQLVQQDGVWSWAVCLTYEAPRSAPGARPVGQIDYRDVLEPQVFAVFVELRKLRKRLSEEQGVPAYALFMNEQIAEIARRRPTTPEGLREIDGVGPARVEKYGESFLQCLRELRSIPPGSGPSARDA